MKKYGKKGFTLIELIAVLVIMAIIALIVTPLVMNIIRKARVAADKRSVDAYGRSIELAVAGYLLDNGRFPQQVSELTIEYSGNEVVCSTTKLNSDSSVYLAGCTVAGRSAGGYTYGTEEVITYDAYSVGDEVTYNNVDYRVIKDSSASEASVTLLKAEPITSVEITQYLPLTEIASKVNTSETYAIMAYYSGDNCVSAGDASGCSTHYSVSDVKQLVDVWKTNYASDVSEARLITIDELTNSFGYEWVSYDITSDGWATSEDTPSWVYNNNYRYWTMSPKNDSESYVWLVSSNGGLYSTSVSNNSYDGGAVRPVIVLPKSALQNN